MSDLIFTDDLELRKKHNLTTKMYFFSRYYVSNGHNGADAARRAGYKGNDHQLSVIADQNLSKLGIKSLIQELEQPVLEKLKVDENWVLSNLKNFADAKITDYFEIKGNSMVLKDFSKLTEDQIRAIESIEETRNGWKIKLVDKKSSVVDIGRTLGMFKDAIEGTVNHEHTHKVYVIPAFGGQFTQEIPVNDQKSPEN